MIVCPVASDSLRPPRLPFPTPGDLPKPISNQHLLCLLHWQVDFLPLCHPGSKKGKGRKRQIRSLGLTYGFPAGSDSKEFACNAADLGLISGSRRSPGEGNGYLLQYSCLENSMDRGAWLATVHGVTKSQTQTRD